MSAAPAATVDGMQPSRRRPSPLSQFVAPFAVVANSATMPSRKESRSPSRGSSATNPLSDEQDDTLAKWSFSDSSASRSWDVASGLRSIYELAQDDDRASGSNSDSETGKANLSLSFEDNEGDASGEQLARDITSVAEALLLDQLKISGPAGHAPRPEPQEGNDHHIVPNNNSRDVPTHTINVGTARGVVSPKRALHAKHPARRGRSVVASQDIVTVVRPRGQQSTEDVVLPVAMHRRVPPGLQNWELPASK